MTNAAIGFRALTAVALLASAALITGCGGDREVRTTTTTEHVTSTSPGGPSSSSSTSRTVETDR